MGRKPEELLKIARGKKSLTQDDMAKKLGITVRQYNKYESGEFPKYKKEGIKKIDEILGTSVYALIYEDIVRVEEVDLEKEIGLLNEKLLRVDAHLEVFKSAIAGLMTKDNKEFAAKFEALQELVEKAINRRFDELERR